MKKIEAESGVSPSDNDCKTVLRVSFLFKDTIFSSPEPTAHQMSLYWCRALPLLARRYFDLSMAGTYMSVPARGSNARPIRRPAL